MAFRSGFQAEGNKGKEDKKFRRVSFFVSTVVFSPTSIFRIHRVMTP